MDLANFKWLFLSEALSMGDEAEIHRLQNPVENDRSGGMIWVVLSVALKETSYFIAAVRVWLGMFVVVRVCVGVPLYSAHVAFTEVQKLTAHNMCQHCPLGPTLQKSLSHTARVGPKVVDNGCNPALCSPRPRAPPCFEIDRGRKTT